MKILIIGGTGFIGRHLCRALARDHEITVFSRHAPPKNLLSCCQDRVNYVLGDVTQSHTINAACSGVECIVYLASTVIPATSNLDPVFDIQSNLVGAVNTLDAAISNQVPRFVFASSGGTVYGNCQAARLKETDATDPICSYGIVKLAIEKYTAMYYRLHGLHYSIIRLSNPYGSGYSLDKPQGAIGFFLDKILKGETIEVWGDGSAERDFIYVQDGVHAIQKAILTDRASLLVNIGTGVPTSINELIAILQSETGRTAKVKFRPSRPFDVQRSVLDISAAKEILKWSPETSLRTGIRLMLANSMIRKL